MNKRLALLYWCLAVPYLFLDAYYHFYWWINFAVLTLFIWLIIMILNKYPDQVRYKRHFWHYFSFWFVLLFILSYPLTEVSPLAWWKDSIYKTLFMGSWGYCFSYLPRRKMPKVDDEDKPA
ncbi:hypothetical protein [Lactococcus sp.]|uniref:hypothetical protein n=1 Tax=Lactococcus sp. TaxID=44273 RepID=UPI0035B05474